MKISYYMAKRIAFTAFVSVALIALGAALSAVSALDRYTQLLSAFESMDRQASASAEPHGVGYIVREHEGIIGVFSTDGRLEYTVEIYVKTLPVADRKLLEKGISAATRTELLEILGDYTG